MEHCSLMQCPVCKTRHMPRQEQKNTGVFAANCEKCGHFFKYKAVAPFKTSVSFTVNGVTYTAGNEFSASTTLNDFLRQKRVSMGTKVMCKQGGCGICIVEAKMTLGASPTKVSAALNSCLCPLFMCDGWEITTIEGLGSTKNGMHKIQSNLSDFNGTQCGYCSPGHVMNMYGLTQKYPNMTKQFLEDHFEGNICRCTGYRPILDAFKALVPASTVDIEELSTKMCTKNPNKVCSGTCHSDASTKAVRLVFDNVQWLKATDYADLLNMLQQYSGQKVKLLGANTGTGYFPSEGAENFDVVIDISGVPEFHVNTYDAASRTFTLGASVTLSDLMELFTREAAKAGNSGGFNELKKYLYRIASSPIRNRATWAGNLMLKNHHDKFPSDVFNIMTVLKARLFVGPSAQDFLTPDAFFSTDMTGKCLSKVTFGDIPAADVVACFKVMPRSQNCLAHVNGAFRCTINPQNFTVMDQPIISLGGISGSFHRARKTEAYLVGKSLSSSQTLTGAMTTLASELVPDSDISLPSPAYRKMVACSLLYKYFLYVLGIGAGARYRSAPAVLHDVRPLSSGTQTYDSDKLEWPVNKPVKKLEADIQCTGEAEYTDDIAPMPGQLYGAFVKSTQANATIQNIDASSALTLAGVFRVLTASDIPTDGKNDITGSQAFNIFGSTEVEEALSSGPVRFCGQPVALVLADTQESADKAASMVKVTYTNIKTPILTIDDAIHNKSTFPSPMPNFTYGNPDQAVSMSPYVTSGSFYIGSQYHFHMETHATVAIPTDEGLDIKTSTQWMDSAQGAVANLCGIPKTKVRVSVKRLGGGYGAKSTRNNITAAVCGMAAYITNRPVRMKMTLQDNMEMVGKRVAYKADYQIGHDANGKINGIIATYYGEQGCLGLEVAYSGSIINYLDNAYYCPNWKANVVLIKTNKPMNTACRSPGSLPAIFVMEQMMEHVARTLSLDPIAVKTLNLYKQGQVTPLQMTLNHCNLEPVMNELMTSGQVALRQKTVEYFNRDNRWKKKALSVVPIKWGVDKQWCQFTVLVEVLSGDGSVLVHHGGIEMGQGINTKVAQVCAYELDIPVTMVTVKGSNSVVEANNTPTGGSVSSEACCQGVILCCTKLKERMAAVKAKMTNPTWKELVNQCFVQRVSLAETVLNTPAAVPPFEYNSYGATCAEVELDVLTGEYQINRVDIVFDCGISLNPAVDVGQVEGAFIMGLGYCTSEEIKYNPANGQTMANDTWTYHPPTNKDIPIDFRVSMLKNAPNPTGVLRSKATGEPPLCMSMCVFFALRKCIEEARKEVGNTSYFAFDAPATVEKVQKACLVDTSQFQLQ